MGRRNRGDEHHEQRQRQIERAARSALRIRLQGRVRIGMPPDQRPALQGKKSQQLHDGTPGLKLPLG